MNTGAVTGASIDIRNLTKAYRNDGKDGPALIAVNNISLVISAGVFVALTGASGSGKSTLLQLIGSLEHADAGTVTVNGLDITALTRRQLPAYRRQVGFVFQRYHLLPALTALDNVTAPVLPLRTEFNKTARAHELLAAVGLEGRETSLPGRLSGGQQQRVAIARAVINHPSLLLADEPTGNLDSRSGDEILHLLAELRGQTGMTVILATHDLQVAATAERHIHMRDGHIDEDRTIA